MNHDFHIQVQAYADGELPAKEAAAVEAKLSQDTAAQELLQELQATNAALVGYEAGVKVPETREFYWSQIQRRIAAEENKEPARKPVTGWFSAWRRLVMPVGTAAAVLVFGFLAGSQMGLFERSSAVAVQADSAVADPGALTYQDFSTRTTLVWLTFPAEN